MAGQELDAQGDGVVRVGEDLAVQGVVRREADAVREAAREERRARGRALHLAVVGVEDHAAPRERLERRREPGEVRGVRPPGHVVMADVVEDDEQDVGLSVGR